MNYFCWFVDAYKSSTTDKLDMGKVVSESKLHDIPFKVFDESKKNVSKRLDFSGDILRKRKGNNSIQNTQDH